MEISLLHGSLGRSKRATWETCLGLVAVQRTEWQRLSLPLAEVEMVKQI